MSVKKQDRHVAKSQPLQKARALVHQLMIITRPALEHDDGSKTKPGILGFGQPFYAYGNDLFRSGKQIHALCYDANEIYLKDDETLAARTELFDKAIAHCNSILRLLDLCIFEYAQNNKKKRKSFLYIAKLTRDAKACIYDRKNRDKLIMQHKLKKEKKKIRRYR